MLSTARSACLQPFCLHGKLQRLAQANMLPGSNTVDHELRGAVCSSCLFGVQLIRILRGKDLHEFAVYAS